MGEQRQRHQRSGKLGLWLGLVALVVAAATAASASPAPEIETATLTADGADSYLWLPTIGATKTGNRLVVHAAEANQGTNLRTVWWSADEPVSQDQQSCVTWRSNTGARVQPGVALRIRTNNGELRAITVSNNVWVGNRAAWNIHTWIARPGQRTELDLIGQVRSLSGLSNDPLDLPSLPWRICGRTVGNTVALKVWTVGSGEPEPSWGDTRFGAVFALPAGWDVAGQPGGYTGHLEAGSEIEFSRETTDQVAPPGLHRVGSEVRAVARTASYQTLGMALNQ